VRDLSCILLQTLAALTVVGLAVAIPFRAISFGTLARASCLIPIRLAIPMMDQPFRFLD
jgi:hypothetical protein